MHHRLIGSAAGAAGRTGVKKRTQHAQLRWPSTVLAEELIAALGLYAHPGRRHIMHSVIYLIGLVVVIMLVLSMLGLR
jgi:hypothetical protein